MHSSCKDIYLPFIDIRLMGQNFRRTGNLQLDTSYIPDFKIDAKIINSIIKVDEPGGVTSHTVSLAFKNFTPAEHYNQNREEYLMYALDDAISSFLMEHYKALPNKEFLQYKPDLGISRAQAQYMLKIMEHVNQTHPLKMEFTPDKKVIVDIGLGRGIVIRIHPKDLTYKLKSTPSGIWADLLFPLGEEEPMIKGKMSIFNSDDYRFCIWRLYNNKCFAKETPHNILQHIFEKEILQYHKLFESLGAFQSMDFDDPKKGFTLAA